MSDPQKISPLLDGFTIGDPISEHHGVVCYPAIKENTNKKYILKVVSVPASQTQFDAMLLAGVYKDPGDAMDYFRSNGEEIIQEAEFLKKLSKIEGFLPYDGWQMEPISRRRLGYEIYLISSYKRSLEKHIRKNAITHLEAINLALDLCSALSVCRQSGYLYVDLKPSNIFVSGKKEYRIGDLGFLPLDALRYASLPERYFSAYTPPELLDPMAPMNLTVDTYAVGMILYQLYNDGHLPFTGVAPEGLPTPCQADYEMAEIIMRAIHQDPAQRWDDPKDLGKAIASYMQRNSVNDIPITPFIPLDINQEEVTSPASENSGLENDSLLEEPENLSESSDLESSIEEEPSVEEESPDSSTVLAENEQENSAEDNAAENADLPENPNSSNIIPKTEQGPEKEDDKNTIEKQPLTSDDNKIPDCEDNVASTLEISEEVAKILSKADDILSHEIPEEIVFTSQPEQEDPFSFVKEDTEYIDNTFPEDPLMDDDVESTEIGRKKHTKHFENPARKQRIKKFFSVCFSLVLLAALAYGGLWYYHNGYLQILDAMTIHGTQDQITVLLDTSVEESKLIVTCMDPNGTLESKEVKGGKVTFSDLDPNTQYTIQVKMSGFHKLVGKTADVFTTEAPTQILTFHAIAGTEDGSVKLTFTVDGEEPDFWNIRYVAEGEDERLETVTGHSAMITGLTVGKVYTFTLDGGKNFALSGETSIQYLASRLILAENIRINSSTGTDITVHWDTPGDVVIENWNVRFYDGYGFEEQITVTENHVLFNGVDPASDYTIEITAAGMTQPARIKISSDPINISEFQMDESAQTEMEIRWEYAGAAPEGGWLLLYTVDGSGSQVIQCEKDHAELSPLIPGANYSFTLQAADGRTVFNNTVSYQAKEAELFNEHNFKPENISVDLLITPEDSNWHYETITEESFTDTFKPGESASMVLRSSSTFYIPGNKTTVLFVFRNSYGNVLPELVTEVSYPWKQIWDHGDKTIGEIDVPSLPSVPGKYVMELYFNGGFVTKADFSITE